MVSDAGATFSSLIDLASERVGGQALAASDEFFAEKENLLKAGRGVFIPEKFTDRGKWMDGWESRRSRRDRGYDWCIIRLGLPGCVRAVDIDTNHFLGNHPPYGALDGLCVAEGEAVGPGSQWVEILPPSSLRPGSQNLFTISHVGRFTHVRLRIYPDGGVARLRIYGEVRPNWASISAAGPINLSAVAAGALVVGCSDQFFGSMHNLLMPGRAPNMGEGWETRRRRGPGHDWAIIRLGAVGRVERVEIDTDHFKGNFPDRCLLEGILAPGAEVTDLILPETRWTPVVVDERLSASQCHTCEETVRGRGPFSHLRLSIFPDGGVSRLRCFGQPVEVGGAHPLDSVARRLDALGEAEAREALARCCGAPAWIDAMMASRPFGDGLSLEAAAERAWWSLTEADWRRAFDHHPRIGDLASLRAKFASTASWAAGEQAGAAQADDATIEALARGNAAYEARFGYLFIVCATGKSAGEMLGILEGRLDNDPQREIVIAAGEQSKITRLRLEKL